jgi:hypothetical protein
MLEYELFMEVPGMHKNTGGQIPAFYLTRIVSDCDGMVCRLSISFVECRRLGLAGRTSGFPAREVKRFAAGSEMIALYLYYKPVQFCCGK